MTLNGAREKDLTVNQNLKADKKKKTSGKWKTGFGA